MGWYERVLGNAASDTRLSDSISVTSEACDKDVVGRNAAARDQLSYLADNDRAGLFVPDPFPVKQEALYETLVDYVATVLLRMRGSR